MRLFCDSSSIVIANLGIQSGNQHQGIVEVLLDARIVGLYSNGTVVVEAHASIANESGRGQKVENHHRLEDIQLKMAVHAAYIDRYIVTDDLGHCHGKGFGLSGIDFSRHDGRTGFVRRDDDFANARAGAGGEHADVIANFHQRTGNGFEGTVRFYYAVVGCEGLKFIGCRHKRQPAQFGNFLGDSLRITSGGIQTCPYRSTSQSQLRQMRHGIFDGSDAVSDLRGIPGKLLTQRERGGIHEVRTANFDHRHVCLGFFVQGFLQQLQTRKGSVHQNIIGRNVHSGGEGVIGGLRLVDIVVGVQHLLCIGELATLKYVSAVGNHLIHVHVGLGA